MGLKPPVKQWTTTLMLFIRYRCFCTSSDHRLHHIITYYNITYYVVFVTSRAGAETRKYTINNAIIYSWRLAVGRSTSKRRTILWLHERAICVKSKRPEANGRSPVRLQTYFYCLFALWAGTSTDRLILRIFRFHIRSMGYEWFDPGARVVFCGHAREHSAYTWYSYTVCILHLL